MWWLCLDFSPSSLLTLSGRNEVVSIMGCGRYSPSFENPLVICCLTTDFYSYTDPAPLLIDNFNPKFMFVRYKLLLYSYINVPLLQIALLTFFTMSHCLFRLHLH